MNKETKKIMEEIVALDDDALELTELRRDKTLKENLEKELEILTQLFPELDADDIPDEVFEACDEGRGLAAQYALWFVKKQKEKEQTEKTNEENAKSAPPEIKSFDDDTFFTPEMVKTMSDKDIRRHYKAIMKSMEKWTNK